MKLPESIGTHYTEAHDDDPIFQLPCQVNNYQWSWLHESCNPTAHIAKGDWLVLWTENFSFLLHTLLSTSIVRQKMTQE